MKKAKDVNGNIVDIEEVLEEESYFCIVCGGELKVKLGSKRQYFSHLIGKNDECEAKLVTLLQLKSAKEISSEVIEKTNKLDFLYNNVLNDKIDNIEGLTQEQINIINSTDKKIKVVAKAGTAKSFTCREYMKKRPHKQKLFIVFNKKLAEECSEDFKDIPNMEVRTTYSLAYKFMGYRYKDKLVNRDIGIFDYAKAMEIFAKTFEDFNLVDKVMTEFNRYLASAYYSIKDFCKAEKLEYNVERYLTIVFNNWKDTTNKHCVNHAFYLKLWQISKPDLSSYCEILALDEAQDISECLADIIENCKVDTVLVTGDFFQELYNFANPTSGFKNITGVEYPLTNCFRIGNTLAKLNSEIFNKFEGKDFMFNGYNTTQKIVKEVDRSKKHTRIYRSNYAIVMDMLNEVDNNKTFYIEGKNGKLNYNYDIIQRVFDFKYNDIIHYSLKSFKNYELLKLRTTDKNMSLELKSAVRIVEALEEQTMIKLDKINSLIVDRNLADIIYSTTHQAKGLSINMPVIIGNDFIDISEDDIDDWEIIQYELYILYVALTRPKNEIELNDSVLMWFQDNYLTFENKYGINR